MTLMLTFDLDLDLDKDLLWVQGQGHYPAKLLKILRLKLKQNMNFLGVKLQFLAKKDPFVRYSSGEKETLL